MGQQVHLRGSNSHKHRQEHEFILRILLTGEVGEELTLFKIRCHELFFAVYTAVNCFAVSAMVIRFFREAPAQHC